ncbi:hypothetical protein [uncultured Psychroserpens sp.]|uniref:hypothetical protein n=1 Tax=uncultured Psychroserpens sp. TaxID=255436 RepID=UPI002602B3BD|nr:hypothetical protein [uncultured Psychroserpens sp.]
MKNLFLLIICVLTVNLSNGQVAEGVECIRGGINTRDITSANPTDVKLEIQNIRGYLPNQSFENLSHIPQASFQNARITINAAPTIVLARYNPMNNALQIKNGDKIYNIVKTDNLKLTFIATNQTYQAISHLDTNGDTVIDYFVFDGNSNDSKLLKKVDYKYTKAKVASSAYGADKPAKLKKVESYYILDNNRSLVSLSTKKKDIKKDFPRQSELILAFIKDNKIKGNKETNLKVLANYVTSIQNNANDGTLVASK